MTEFSEKALRAIVREEVAKSAPAPIELDAVVRTSVHQTLITLGIDTSDPIQIQQDFAFLSEMRAAHSKVRTRGMMIMVGLVLTSIATAAWLGLKELLSGGAAS
jgi:hypothetical protein